MCASIIAKTACTPVAEALHMASIVPAHCAPVALQITPSDPVRGQRAAAVCEGDANAASSLSKTAADVTDALRSSRVLSVTDDNAYVCVAALRDALAARMPHHISPSPKAMVLSGPFGSGKKLLMQRVLSLHPDKFGLAPVYTTATTAGGTFEKVEEDFIHCLGQEGLLLFMESAAGHLYAVSKADTCRCCPYNTV
jgi:hypothetical protein